MTHGKPFSWSATMALAAGLMIAFPILGAMAAQVVAVSQKGRAFAVREVTLSSGDVIRFTNEDDFPHQINIGNGTFALDSDLQESGEALSIPFPVPGIFQVRCGIHPIMRMTIRVQ
jgi:plastocyanin